MLVDRIKTNRIASVNGTAFSYDASGNVTNDGARSYTYDAEKRIVSVSEPSSESYGYDAGNHRVKKVVGGVVTHYIWEGNQVIAEYERGGGSSQATGTRYYHQDRLSTRLITNGAGAVVGTTDQAPFGEEVGGSGEGEKHKFTSYERDGTGLDYAVNRHYDPRQGRFNQVDPLGMGAVSLADPQSLNLYSYVRNDPMNAVDPSGLRPSWNMESNPYGLGGSGDSSSFLIDGVPVSSDLAFSVLHSGVGMIGPLNTTNWDPELNQGKGGWEQFRVGPDGRTGWGHWEAVTERAVDKEGNVLWQYGYAEWHWRIQGDLAIHNGELVVSTGGVIRDFDGSIIGERPIEMQMLGPLDAIGPGELKAGIAVAGVLGIGARGLLKSAATGGIARLTQGGLEHIVARHWATSGIEGISKFAAGTSLRDLKSMINQTVSQGSIRANTHGRPGIIYEFNFGRTIGVNSSGAAASNLRIVVGANGNVVTSFPF